MKIVCESCSAKYSIADEKVAGRVFKIRCKKCGAAIVVRGDQQGAEAAAPAPGAGGYDYGGEAVWHAVVDGDQQGPFTPAQLGAMISENRIGWDAYVWREGFDDWKPAQDIEELVQAIMNPGGGAPAQETADPFADSATVAQQSQRPASTKAARDAGADLFAPSSASPFGGGDDDDVVSSAPSASPRVSAQQAMTGQRNENSVLFSLSNLQALATGGPAASAGPAKAAPKPGMAMGEGSGLIDIRALASATGVSGGGAAASPMAAPPKVDDLLSIGAPSVGLGSALAAPVIIADKTPEKSGNGVLIGGIVVGVSVIAAAAIIAVVMLNSAPDPAAAPAATALAPGATPPAAPATTATAPATAPAVGATAPAAVPPTTAAPATPAGTPATPAATTPSTEAGGSGGGGGGGGRRRPSGGSGGGGGSTASTEATEAPPAAPAGGSGGGGSGGGRRPSGESSSIDDLLQSALSGGGSGGARRPSGGGGSPTPSGGGGGGAPAGGPETPSRGDVVSAMQGVSSAVSACGNGEHGTATVAVTVSGSTGRVTGANVTGQFAGTPVGSCIARAVRGATFPRFTRPTFTVNYPFRI